VIRVQGLRPPPMPSAVRAALADIDGRRRPGRPAGRPGLGRARADAGRAGVRLEHAGSAGAWAAATRRSRSTRSRRRRAPRCSCALSSAPMRPASASMCWRIWRLKASRRRARRPARCPGRRRCTSCTARSGRRCVCSWFTAVVTSRAPLAPSGWPSAIAPPFGLTRGSSSARPEVAQHRQALRGEGLVELDHVHLRQRQAGQLQHLARRRRRADAHDARRHAGGGHADDAGRGVRPWRAAARSLASSSAQAPSLTPEALPASPCRRA
jgi:hypothetical protein